MASASILPLQLNECGGKVVGDDRIVRLGTVGRLEVLRGAFMVAEPAAEHPEHRIERSHVASRGQRALANRAGLAQPAGGGGGKRLPDRGRW